MKTVSSFALAMVLAAGAFAPAPALAQRAKTSNQNADAQQPAQEAQAPAEATAGGRKFNFSKDARKPIVALQQALAADAATFGAAVAAADAAAQNSDDRYYIAQLKLRRALDTNDDPGTLAALEALATSGGATQEELPKLYNNIGTLHYNAKRYDQAATAFQRVIDLNPTYEGAANNLAASLAQQNNPAAAAAALEQRIAAARASGQPAPQELYKQALSLAYQAKSPKALELSREMAVAYPTGENWRNAVNIYRQMRKPPQDVQLDALRLLRAAKAMDTQDDYLLLAYYLQEGDYYAEAKAAVEEGFASGKVQRSNSDATQILGAVNGKIADDRAALAGLESRARSGANGTLALRLAEGYYGHGNHAKAAEFYRLALQKGGVDANLVNSRLGMALAMSGQKAEAETAFKAVSGPRQELASYWLLWLNQRG